MAVADRQVTTGRVTAASTASKNSNRSSFVGSRINEVRGEHERDLVSGVPLNYRSLKWLALALVRRPTDDALLVGEAADPATGCPSMASHGSCALESFLNRQAPPLIAWG